jgi:dihydropteroate synthase
MFTLNCKGKLIVFESPLVMGIVNITPDSFYAGSRFTNSDAILSQAEKMIEEGADILDLGGQSTRPGSEAVTVEEELKRVIPNIGNIHRHFPDSITSVDTFYSKVAVEAVNAGASIVNDISAGRQDEKMLTEVAALKVPFVAMHMRGNPSTMQELTTYDNLVRELLDFFIEKREQCRQAGIKDLIIDPGFGFAKTIGQNFELLKNLSVFKMLDLPILVGLSRKSTIYKTLNISAEEALNGTTVLNTIALMNGANIIRVHDVKEARETVKLFAELRSK